MSPVREFILWLSNKRTITRAIGTTGMKLGFARRFIAGETLDEALRVAADLNARGLLVVMNQLGEHVRDRAEADAAFRSYHRILEAIAARRIDGSITVKPTQLGLEFDPQYCATLTLELAREASTLGNFVEIDMEHSAVAEATVAMFERVRGERENVGLALQSYLRRTAADLERLERFHPKIRLVKGAYQEPPEVAFVRKRDVDERFASLMRTLFERGFHPAIATHDESLINLAIGLAKEHGVQPERWEVQMLLGVRRDLQEKLARDGYRSRVYVTFGTEWVPYFMRRLAERPANVGFVLRSLLRRH